MSLNKDTIIKQYVSRLESGVQGVYKQCIEAVAKMPLKTITEKNAGRVLEDYLFVWGNMARVVGQNVTWQNVLVGTIREKAKTLESLRHMKLEDENLTKSEAKIKECYESFKKRFKQVAAAKILHLLCPDFFPPWDDDIEKAYRGIVRKDERGKPFSSEDYFRFMQWVQDFIKTNSTILTELSKKYGKSKVRIVDECLLYAVRNPFSHIL
jgi:hypothetical protein